MDRPGIELVKWLGLGAMLYDHAALFAGFDLPGAAGVGAVAFPAFCVALAAGVGSSPAAKRAEVVKRLLVWGFFAQVAVIFVRDPMPLNVLFTLGASLGAYGAIELAGWRRAGTVGGFLLLGSLSEFSLPGVLFGVLVLGHVAGGWSRWWPVAAAVPLYIFNEGSFLAVVGALGALYLVEHGPSLPRIRRIFYPAYLIQFPLWRLLS